MHTRRARTARDRSNPGHDESGTEQSTPPRPALQRHLPLRQTPSSEQPWWQLIASSNRRRASRGGRGRRQAAGAVARAVAHALEELDRAIVAAEAGLALALAPIADADVVAVVGTERAVRAVGPAETDVAPARAADALAAQHAVGVTAVGGAVQARRAVCAFEAWVAEALALAEAVAEHRTARRGTASRSHSCRRGARVTYRCR